jgi:hypothetical protein
MKFKRQRGWIEVIEYKPSRSGRVFTMSIKHRDIDGSINGVTSSVSLSMLKTLQKTIAHIIKVPMRAKNITRWKGTLRRESDRG